MTAVAIKDKFVSQGREIHPVTAKMMEELGI